MCYVRVKNNKRRICFFYRKILFTFFVIIFILHFFAKLPQTPQTVFDIVSKHNKSMVYKRVQMKIRMSGCGRRGTDNPGHLGHLWILNQPTEETTHKIVQIASLFTFHDSFRAHLFIYHCLFYHPVLHHKQKDLCACGSDAACVMLVRRAYK